MLFSFRRVATSIAIALALCAPLTSQSSPCNFGDDGLANFGCCGAAQTALPHFPGFQVSGSYACFKDCAVEATFPVRISTVHLTVLCDIDIVQITVTPGTATSPGFTGLLVAKYVRTWIEIDPNGLPTRQVWRFLVNGDLTPNAGAQPCPIPPHAAGATTNFHGSIDYACETGTSGVTTYSVAISLNHLPGCIEHNLFSCAPAVGAAAHDDRSYHLVAPGTFTFGAAPVPAGSIGGESVRSAQFVPVYGCLGEAPVLQGAITLQSQDCRCQTITPGSQAWTNYDISGVVGCVGLVAPFRCVPVAPPLPPLPNGCTALPIGAWTGAPGTFPGPRELVAHWGVIFHPDPCQPGHPPYSFVQGVSTRGAPGIPFATPNSSFPVFLDFEDMIDPNALINGPIQPRWGCLFLSKLVWSLNLP